MFLMLVFTILASGSILYHTLRTGISPTPTLARARRAILAAIPDGQTGLIVDLGSGWGTLVVPLAARFPRARVRGYELSWVPYGFSRLRLAVHGFANLRLDCRDFFLEPLAEADIVVCYLYTGAMRRLREKFESELRPGTLVISHTFAIHGWQPEQIIRLPDTFSTRIYLYRVAGTGEGQARS